MFRLNRNERSRWSGNGVHVEPESVFMIGRNMHDKVGDEQIFVLADHGYVVIFVIRRVCQ